MKMQWYALLLIFLCPFVPLAEETVGEPGIPRLIDLPPQRVLVVDAKGDPNSVAGPAFKALFKAFYSGADRAAKSRPVYPMARWAVPQLDSAKAGWQGSYALPIPESFPSVPAGAVREEVWQYGLTAEILHLGAYADEGTDIAALKAFIARNGLAITGSHEEVYLRGPGMIFKGNPKKYRTLIRYTVERVGELAAPIAGAHQEGK